MPGRRRSCDQVSGGASRRRRESGIELYILVTSEIIRGLLFQGEREKRKIVCVCVYLCVCMNVCLGVRRK